MAEGRKLAGTGARTPDLLITNQLLYQLSYTGIYLSKRLTLTRLRLTYRSPN